MEDCNLHNIPNRERYKELVRSNRVFGNLSDEELGSLMKHALVKEYKKGKSLFFIGDRVDSLYLVVEGCIKLYRETRDGSESVIAVKTKGKLVNIEAVIKNSYFKYSAQAAEDSNLIMIGLDVFQNLLEKTQSAEQMNSDIFKELEDLIGLKNLYAEHLAKMTSHERVGCYLLRCSNAVGQASTYFTLPYEKSLIAGELGMTPETFSRSLMHLVKIGVSNEKTVVTIKDVNLLCSAICKRCSATKDECVFGSP